VAHEHYEDYWAKLFEKVGDAKLWYSDSDEYGMKTLAGPPSGFEVTRCSNVDAQEPPAGKYRVFQIFIFSKRVVRIMREVYTTRPWRATT
jgi:hypothetical protein